MRKVCLIFFISLLAFSSILVGGSTSFADSETQMIRIGVVPSAESLRIGSADDFTITNKETGEVIYSGEAVKG